MLERSIHLVDVLGPRVREQSIEKRLAPASLRGSSHPSDKQAFDLPGAGRKGRYGDNLHRCPGHHRFPKIPTLDEPRLARMPDRHKVIPILLVAASGLGFTQFQGELLDAMQYHLG